MGECCKDEALAYLGSRYVKLPRVIWDDLMSMATSRHMCARLYLALFLGCEYTDKTLEINGRKMVCHTGEFITTYKELSYLTGMSVRSISYYVKKLVELSLLQVSHMSRQSRFEVVGYEEFMEETSQPGNKKRQPAKPDKPKSGKTAPGAQNVCERKPRLDLIEKEYA